VKLTRAVQLVVATASLAVGVPAGAAYAGAECNHGTHTNYHAPYAHRDTWTWNYGISDSIGHHENFYSANDGGKDDTTGHC